MTHPSCPNCRERMSFAEAGLCGVWSCIYCEGVWLHPRELAKLASPGADSRVAAASDASVRSADDRDPVAASLVCAACNGEHSFHRIDVEGVAVYGCSGCRGLFLPKVAVEGLSGRLPTTNWLSAADLKQQGLPQAIASEVLGTVIGLVVLALLS